jgi:glutamate-ammonia-ligase adenylyltransferase
MDGFDTVGGSLSDLADSVVTAAVDHLAPGVPLAVIGMGRLGGRELTYTSDLDLLLVWDAPGAPPAEAAVTAEATAAALTRLVGGASPATGAYPVDLGLRPEGRHGPPARSLDAYTAYYGRWAEPWERQALLRSRFVAGDRGVADRFARLVDGFVWGSALTPDDVRAIRRSKARMERERVPTGEDPKFHLKLGPGSMSDVEWTVQLLQLRHSVRGTGTMEALGELLAIGAIAGDDAAVLQESYRFCGRARNRLSLIRDVPSDSLPVTGPVLSTLARSLGVTAAGLRNEYTRVTRRARRVMETVFYGS